MTDEGVPANLRRGIGEGAGAAQDGEVRGGAMSGDGRHGRGPRRAGGRGGEASEAGGGRRARAQDGAGVRVPSFTVIRDDDLPHNRPIHRESVRSGKFFVPTSNSPKIF